MTAIIKTIVINAPREVVWAHLTEKEKLAGWFQPPKHSLREGQSFIMQGPVEEDCDGRVWGRVLKMSPPESLIWSFTHNQISCDTTVTITLTAINGGTEVTLTHDGLEDSVGDVERHIRDHDQGWGHHLDLLKRDVENEARAA